jgi:hypothetical protein
MPPEKDINDIDVDEEVISESKKGDDPQITLDF